MQEARWSIFLSVKAELVGPESVSGRYLVFTLCYSVAMMIGECSQPIIRYGRIRSWGQFVIFCVVWVLWPWEASVAPSSVSVLCLANTVLFLTRVSIKLTSATDVFMWQAFYPVMSTILVFLSTPDYYLQRGEVHLIEMNPVNHIIQLFSLLIHRRWVFRRLEHYLGIVKQPGRRRRRRGRSIVSLVCQIH